MSCITLNSIQRLLLHLRLQHPRLILHLFHTPRLPLLIIHRWKILPSSAPPPSPFPSIFPLLPPQMRAHIPLLPIQQIIHRIRSPKVIQIRPLPRNHMRMNMRDTLACIDAVLDRDVETTRAVDALDHASDTPHCEEEVAGLGGCEVRDAGDDTARGHENVSWEDRFEVHEADGQWGLVEDLVFGVLVCWFGCGMEQGGRLGTDLGGDEEGTEVDRGAL